MSLINFSDRYPVIAYVNIIIMASIMKANILDSTKVCKPVSNWGSNGEVFQTDNISLFKANGSKNIQMLMRINKNLKCVELNHSIYILLCFSGLSGDRVLVDMCDGSTLSNPLKQSSRIKVKHVHFTSTVSFETTRLKNSLKSVTNCIKVVM